MVVGTAQIIEEVVGDSRLLCVTGGLGICFLITLHLAWKFRRNRRGVLFLLASCVFLLVMLTAVEGRARFVLLKADSRNYLAAILADATLLDVSPISTDVQQQDIRRFFSEPIPQISQIEYGWEFADHFYYIVGFDNGNRSLFSVAPHSEGNRWGYYSRPRFCVQDIVSWNGDE